MQLYLFTITGHHDFDPQKRYRPLSRLRRAVGQTVLDAWGGRNRCGHRCWPSRVTSSPPALQIGHTGARADAWRKIVYRKLGIVSSADSKPARAISKWPLSIRRRSASGWSGAVRPTLNALFATGGLLDRTRSRLRPDLHYYETIYQERYGGCRKTTPKMEKQSSPSRSPAKLKRNLLLIHVRRRKRHSRAPRRD